jgi:hypothetical protein
VMRERVEDIGDGEGTAVVGVVVAVVRWLAKSHVASRNACLSVMGMGRCGRCMRVSKLTCAVSEYLSRYL